MSLQTHKKIALVIGSGGLKCAASIGVIKVLNEERIPLDLVVGCSGGSVIGASIALGDPPDEVERKVYGGWGADITRKLDLPSLLSIVGLKRFKPDIGIFDDTVMLKNLISELGADNTFADTKIPFYCVATDFYTGKPVVISEGSLVQAIRTSSGIPIVFKPMKWQDTLLTDGAISNPLPIDVAIKNGADIIIAMGFETPAQADVATPAAYASQMFTILSNQLLSKTFALYNLTHHSEIIMMIPEFKEVIKVNDTTKIPFIVKQGEIEARKQIGYLKQLLEMD